MHCLPLKLAAVLAWATAVACWDLSAQGSSGINYGQLSQKLSKTAQIYLPGSEGFDAAVARWSNYSVPVANVVVLPGTENDVVEIVRLLSALQDSNNSLLISTRLRSTSQISTQYPFLPPMACMDP